MKSQLIFKKKFPHPRTFGSETILIYDSHFNTVPKVRKWLKKFPLRYAVESGEKLKSLEKFPVHLQKILEKTEGLSRHGMKIVSLGGGSVGDFSGFVASVLKRGVPLLHIPSTWLSAVDSAHGGKNALNVAGFKNQVGTFYPAEKIYLIQELLETQSEQRLVEAFGEILKISLISGGSVWRNLQNQKYLSSELYWKNLKSYIEAKMKIVRQDPYEQKGLRQILNLGHTVGHVWETNLKFPHGLAILYGIAFALEWSLHRKTISSKKYYAIRLSEIGSYLPDRLDLKRILKVTSNASRLLQQDKKVGANGKIRFIFLAGPGQPIVEAVRLEEVLNEMRRQSR